MKRLMTLLQYVLADASAWCRTNSMRDYQTITQRVENEGLSFLTITLPSFCKDFERSLDRGRVTPSDFAGFSKSGALPRLLGGLLELVFERDSGVLLNEPSLVALFFVRQITLMFKKIRLPCTEERNRAAFKGYVECEKEVGRFSETMDEDKLRSFVSVSRLVLGTVLSDIDACIMRGEHRPKHGPGATADKLAGNGKYQLKHWYERIERSFPSADFAIPNWGYRDNLEGLNFLEPDSEIPTKVITVPKTLKTPRIIAIEPTCMQYVQQSILELLVRHLECDKLQGILGFTDQTPNQRMARIGSLDSSLATLDLSEASDRVSNRLVSLMTMPYTYLHDALQDCRSSRADVPGHGVISLAKYASMGSATCFPVEAMVFVTAVFVGLQSHLGRTLTKADVKRWSPLIRVYGDDIVCPTPIVQDVVESLESYGFKVNSRKSFWTGKFRESCGRDYYDGNDMTVTYCRSMLPHDRHDVRELVGTVALRNQLYEAGLWETVRYLDRLLGEISPLPLVGRNSPALGRHSFLGYETHGWNRELHRPFVRAHVVVAKIRKSPLDDSYALLKFFLKRGDEPTFDAKHLERSGRPERVDIKVRRVSPF